MDLKFLSFSKKFHEWDLEVEMGTWESVSSDKVLILLTYIYNATMHSLIQMSLKLSKFPLLSMERKPEITLSLNRTIVA